MKEELYAWYQGLEYEEGFSPDEVLSFQEKKKRIDTYVIISEPNHSERKNSLVRIGIWGSFFDRFNTYTFLDNVNTLTLSKDQGLISGRFV